MWVGGNGRSLGEGEVVIGEGEEGSRGVWLVVAEEAVIVAGGGTKGSNSGGMDGRRWLRRELSGGTVDASAAGR